MHVCVGLRPSLHPVLATQEDLWGDLKTPDDVQAASQVNGTLGISGCRSRASVSLKFPRRFCRQPGLTAAALEVLMWVRPHLCSASLPSFSSTFLPVSTNSPSDLQSEGEETYSPSHWMCLSSGATPRADLPHPWAELIHNTAGKASARSTIRRITPSTADQWQTQHFSAALLGKQREISP